MGRENMMIMSYDPRKHPCKDCTNRTPTCHGECELYKEFERTRPRTPRNLYNARGRMRDIFHKKGRIIRRS